MLLRHIVFHAPGPKWQDGVNFREQPGVMAHVQHYAQLHQQGKLHQGGPFTAPNAGGMMIATNEISRDELEAFAACDPAVKAGLLTFEVKTWYVAMAEEGLVADE